MDDYYKHDDFVNNFNVCHIDNLCQGYTDNSYNNGYLQFSWTFNLILNI